MQQQRRALFLFPPLPPFFIAGGFGFAGARERAVSRKGARATGRCGKRFRLARERLARFPARPRAKKKTGRAVIGMRLPGNRQPIMRRGVARRCRRPSARARVRLRGADAPHVPRAASSTPPSPRRVSEADRAAAAPLRPYPPHTFSAARARGRRGRRAGEQRSARGDGWRSRRRLRAVSPPPPPSPLRASTAGARARRPGGGGAEQQRGGEGGRTGARGWR